MVKRRKGFSAAHSRLTSFRLRSATLGTHVPRRASCRPNVDAVDFSSSRKKKRAVRGYVNNVLSASVQNTDSSHFFRNTNRREFSQVIQGRARLRRILTVVVCIVLVMGIATGVGLFTFLKTLNEKIALKNSDASAALVVPETEDTPFYTIVSADLDMPGVPYAEAGPDALALVRIDKAAQMVTIVSVPPNLQVVSKDGETCSLREIKALEGDAAFIRSIANFAGVDIAHFVTIDAQGIIELVDWLGDIEVNVSEDVDDPSAGDVYLYAGDQLLDGQATLTLLRAQNFSDGSETQAGHQRAALAALSSCLLDKSMTDFLSLIDTVDSPFNSDLNIRDVLSLFLSLRDSGSFLTTGALVPGYYSANSHDASYIVSKDAWTSMMDLVDAGKEPVAEDESMLMNPAEFTLTIRNGGGIAGAAAQMSETLKNRGFQVESIGNTDATVYSETLAIYKDKNFEPAVQTVISALGMGRPVENTSFYTFDTDVLLILGKDWKPSS